MNHDYCHCLDYKKSECPKDCFRAMLEEDKKKRYAEMTEMILSYGHLKGGKLCKLTWKVDGK